MAKSAIIIATMLCLYARSQPCDNQTYATTLAQLINATNVLETAAADAAASLQVDVSYENATIALARLWSDIIIPKDRGDASEDGIASDYVQWLNISERKPNSFIEGIIASLPCNQTKSAGCCICCICGASDCYL